MIRVHGVDPDSIGAELGVTAGFELLSVDGRDLEDFLDWEFLTAEDAFVLRARAPNGELVEYDIERPEGDPLGIQLEPPHVRRCGNRCDFCFVDGLPAGLRDTLYVRDDDYRLSFRYGNFATLTNLKARDVQRILSYRLSPLYVSVHATDVVVRRRLLRNPRAPAILQQLHELAAGGISFHTQIVLQPGVNDGEQLERTLTDLYLMGAPILSVSVVPVGLTEFSKHHRVREPTAVECEAAVGVVHHHQERALAERGRRWVYGSDDLYYVAGMAFPPAEAYDEFEQVENGVGSVRYLQRRIGEERSRLQRLDGKRIAVVTGVAMGRHMPEVLQTLTEATGGTFEVVSVENDLFGPSVTSAGLLPGRAILRALERCSACDLALLPAEAINDNGLLLDDLGLAELEARAPVAVRSSYHFTDALMAEDRQ